MAREWQVTHAPHGHVLANTGVWSPDGAWIVYDCRDSGEKFEATRIERIHVDSGRIETVYEARHGAACGVATWHPREARVVFILGPEFPTPEWNYGISRRRGVVVDLSRPGVPQPLEAMNYAPPFVPGALRGGSHVHVFSADGERVSFTYDDHLLSLIEPDGADAVRGRRNIGVAVAAHPVRVAGSHPRNHDGNWFSVLVSRTVARPRPGSDEIGRAAEEGWVGREGYVRPDGTRQRRALAFQGTVTAHNGRTHAEVFLLDLPDDLTQPGNGPLEGTLSELPAPPRGVQQRRLTHTGDQRYPGIAVQPRHWLRASPDGGQIAFLMRDDNGRTQFWLVASGDGALRQLSRHPWDVTSSFTWSPDGRWLAHSMDGSVFVTDTLTGKGCRLTVRAPEASAPHHSVAAFSPEGGRIAYLRRRETGGVARLQVHVVALPSHLPAGTAIPPPRQSASKP